MQATGILCAVEQELEPFLAVLQGGTPTVKGMVTFHQGTINERPVVALYCGVCKVNAAIATQILIDRFHVDAVIVSGTAGAIDSSLAIGDSVIATEVCYHDVAEGILTGYHPWMPGECFAADPALLALCRENITTAGNAIHYGRMATGEAFIDKDGRQAIIEKCDPLCTDMETAGVAHVCYANQVPFMAVRSISDTPDLSGQEVFYENCRRTAAQSFQIVWQLLGLMNGQSSVGNGLK